MLDFRHETLNGAFRPGSWVLERENLATFLAMTAAIPICWLVVLGWPFGSLLSGHDAVLQVIAPLRDLAEGTAPDLRYRPELMGGVKLADAFGNLTLPYFRAAIGVGVQPVTAYNAFVILCQILIAGAGIGAVRALTAVWHGEGVRLGWVASICTGVLLAFAPVLAWRIYYGHLNLLLGGMAYYLLFCAIAIAAARRLTVSMCVLLVLGLWHCLQATSQQVLLYGLVFGGPLLLALFWHATAASGASRWRTLLVLAILCGIAGLAAAPAVQMLYAHATSSDAPRGLGGDSVIYRYAVAGWRDWLASIPWSKDLIGTGRSPELQHELNYAFGVLLAALLLMPRAALWTVGAAFGAGMAAALLFSMGVEPFSTVLPDLIRPLHAFRVPSRALLPLAFVAPVLAIAALARPPMGGTSVERVAPWKLGIAALVALVFAFGIMPPGAREGLVWLTVPGAYLVRRFKMSPLTIAVVLLPLAGASLAAFKERGLPFTPQAALVGTVDRFGRDLRAAEPRLQSALTRVHLDFQIGGMWLNTGYAMRVATLDGYWAPSRRLLKLHAALEDAPYDATQVALAVPPSSRSFAALQQLYNICCEATVDAGRIALRSLGPTAGPAWIAQRVEHAADAGALAAALRRSGERLVIDVRETLWLVDDDPWAATSATRAISPGPHCRNARIDKVDAPHWSGRITVDVIGGAGCPLVLATSFAETLQARDQDGRRLRTFPANCALLGVLLDQGSRRVSVQVP